MTFEHRAGHEDLLGGSSPGRPRSGPLGELKHDLQATARIVRDVIAAVREAPPHIALPAMYARIEYLEQIIEGAYASTLDSSNRGWNVSNGYLRLAAVQCPLCKDVLFKPCTLECGKSRCPCLCRLMSDLIHLGHSFCSQCILPPLKEALKCPLCSLDISRLPFVSYRLQKICALLQDHRTSATQSTNAAVVKPLVTGPDPVITRVTPRSQSLVPMAMSVNMEEVEDEDEESSSGDDDESEEESETQAQTFTEERMVHDPRYDPVLMALPGELGASPMWHGPGVFGEMGVNASLSNAEQDQAQGNGMNN